MNTEQNLDYLDSLAQSLRDAHKQEIEQTLKTEFNALTDRACNVFRNLNVESDFNVQVQRIMAHISYLHSCLQSVQKDDLRWYRNYVKACLAEIDVVDITNIKEVLIEKLTKY